MNRRQGAKRTTYIHRHVWFVPESDQDLSCESLPPVLACRLSISFSSAKSRTFFLHVHPAPSADSSLQLFDSGGTSSSGTKQESLTAVIRALRPQVVEGHRVGTRDSPL